METQPITTALVLVPKLPLLSTLPPAACMIAAQSGTPPVIESTNAVTRKHHKYGPSKTNYLLACAGFKNNDGTSEAAEQGTFLHDIMDKILQHVVKKNAATCLEQVAAWVTKTYELADEEIDYIRFCCKRCDVFIAKKPTAIYTEIDVNVTGDDKKELNHGFLDVLFVFGDTGILQDFKFGWEPVKPATSNLQGQNYVLGCFQKFRTLNKIGVEFIQPKLNWISSALFHRSQMAEIYERLASVIRNAEFVQQHPEQAQDFMAAGSYCKYCARATVCPVLANVRGKMVSRYQDLPMPPSFKGLELTKPEDIALARYWCDLAETATKEIKHRAFEIAELNGGSISCVLPSGEVVAYAVQEKNSDRSLGSAIEVAEALKEVCSSEEILGAAELAIGKLETIVKNAMVELAKARGEKLTKKAAWEQIQSTLEAHGLLTRADTKIRFLKQQKTTKQIENKQ